MNHLYAIFLIYWLVSYIDGGVLNEIGRVYIPDSGFGGAENVAVAYNANRIFAADGYSIGLNVLSFYHSDDLINTNMIFEERIYFSSIFQDFGIQANITAFDVTSVCYSPSKDFIIASIVPLNYAIEYGWLAFVDPYNLTIFNLIELIECYLPDHITTTNNGDIIVISCEGEADDNTIEYPQYNPPGSVELVYVNSTNMEDWSVINIGFTDFDVGGNKNHLLPNDVYLPYKNESFSINAEPEYGTCSIDNRYCYICLQEQNVIAILDLDINEFIDIFSLGTNDYNISGLDASDQDNMINIMRYPNLFGLRMPDAIDYFQSKENRNYIFTANEGDSKIFDESRVNSLSLDVNGSFIDIDIDELQKNENLGRLKVTNLWGKIEKNEENTDDDIYEKLYAFSSRDFTVFEIIYNENDELPTTKLIYSSIDMFEQITADILGAKAFNSNDYVPSFDTRSDDKGPEPESIVTSTCNNGNSFVFIGMKRVGGIFVYDITNIDNGDIEYVEYINNRDFDIEYDEGTRAPIQAGDVGPEQLVFVDEDIFGIPLLVVANAESASVTMYKINCDTTSSIDDDEVSTLLMVGIIIGSVFIAMISFALCLYFANRKHKQRHREIETETGSLMTKLTSTTRPNYSAFDDNDTA